MPDFTVQISDLRTRITFQEPTQSQDTGGAQTASYAIVTTNPTVWSRWINAHGQEAISNDALRAAQRATVTIRYRSDIQLTWQILKDGEAWQIISIDHVQDRNRWTEMIVERVKGTL